MQDCDAVWFGKKLDAQNRRIQAQDAQEYERQLLARARLKLGQMIAAQMELSEAAQLAFAKGFAGIDAKVADPRKDGLEAVFREGRKHFAQKGVAQQIRALLVEVRREFALWQFLEDKYYFSPCPYEYERPEMVQREASEKPARLRTGSV